MINYKTIYTIVDTKTNEFVSINGRSGWVKSGNAKNAWNVQSNAQRKKLFNEQSRYIIKAIECKDGN